MALIWSDINSLYLSFAFLTFSFPSGTSVYHQSWGFNLWSLRVLWPLTDGQCFACVNETVSDKTPRFLEVIYRTISSGKFFIKFASLMKLLKIILKMDLQEIQESLTKLNQSCFFCQFWPSDCPSRGLSVDACPQHAWHQHIPHKWIRNLSGGNIRTDLDLQTPHWTLYSAFTHDTEYKILLPSESR